MARQYSQKISKAITTQTGQNNLKNSRSNDANGKQKDTKGKGKARAVESTESVDKFREAVLALGGDEEDYKLLKDFDSDDENTQDIESKDVEDVSTAKKF